MIGRRGLYAGIACLALSACAVPNQLSRVAVDHNRMIERSTNELTLLNIIRAQHRFPLHFTAITSVNGDAELSVSSEISIGLDDDFDLTGQVIEGGISTNPGFQASVLATDKFQRGIQAPLPAELIAYYLNEGWRSELLMALTVERVERAGGGAGGGDALENDARKNGAFAQLLCTHEFRFTQGSGEQLQLAAVEDLLPGFSARNGLASSAGTVQSATAGNVATFLDLLERDHVSYSNGSLVLDQGKTQLQLAPRAIGKQALEAECGGLISDPALVEESFTPVLRSTLGVIYFLGEYHRRQVEFAQGAARSDVYLLPSFDDEQNRWEYRPLIALAQGSGTALVATGFRGERYFVPASGNGRSGYAAPQAGVVETARTMQVFAFVQQIINLQKSADQLPTSLNLIGGR